MADPQDRVDIPGVVNPASLGVGEGPAHRRHSVTAGGKRWLGILFNCCHTYARVYRDDRTRQYRGRCPACGAEITVPIGPGGTNRRFFETST